MVNSILKLTRAQQTRVMIAVLMSKSGLNYFQSVSSAVIEAADLVFYVNTTNAWKFFFRNEVAQILHENVQT